MLNRHQLFIIIAKALIIGFLSGCIKESYTEDQRNADYELNKQNSLRLFTPVMYNDPDKKQEELFKIVHISDAHLSPWSSNNHFQNPRNLKEAARFANEPAAKINAIVMTGDLIGNNNTTTRNEAINYLNNFVSTLYQSNSIPAFISTGNHDVNMLNSNYQVYAISKTEYYNIVTSKINRSIYSDDSENYYYADMANPMGGFIRLIALDVIDQDTMIYSAQYNAILSQKQIDWLCHTALKKDMTDNHSVIILIHHPLPPVDDEDASMSIQNDFLHNWNMIPEIIETYRTKQTLSKKYLNKTDASDSISVDVSFSNSPGEFVCYLGGHLHTYLNYEVISSVDSTLPNQIMILANNMSPSDKSPTSHIERRETGLRNNTFNLYAIDTKNKIIYVTFFGATAFYYPQVLSLHYL